MLWEIALLVQSAWGIAASTDGIARTLYSFLRLPHHDITSFEYSVLYALPRTTYPPNCQARTLASRHGPFSKKSQCRTDPGACSVPGVSL